VGIVLVKSGTGHAQVINSWEMTGKCDSEEQAMKLMRVV
jgi:hypothetical protein